VASLLLAAPAFAHSTEPSRSLIEVSKSRVEWVVRARALDLAHALAADRDSVTLAHDPRLEAYARSRIRVVGESGKESEALSVIATPEGAFVRLELRFEAPAGDALWLRSRFLNDSDREHRDLARVVVEGGLERGFAFGPAGDTLLVERGAPCAWALSVRLFPVLAALVAAGLAGRWLLASRRRALASRLEAFPRRDL